MSRVEIKPELLRWALERSSRSPLTLEKKFPKLGAWVSGEASPTFKQLETFAKATSTPIGYLFLPEPPEERLPIQDFRTLPGIRGRKPSPELLDTLYAMQRRQAWLRETLIENDSAPPSFVGSASLADNPAGVGREMRRVTGIAEAWAAGVRTWRQAVSELRRAIEELGVMAVINGVVGNNTHRPLDVKEFRGFALSDPHAPLIFVNGADAKSAQMFTLAHELAHIWLGTEGLSGFDGLFPGGSDVENWCDQAAAEFLVPAEEIRARWPTARRGRNAFEILARAFKVSPIVAGRRALDLKLVDRHAFFDFYKEYVAIERQKKAGRSGGDFYKNQNTRVGELLATQVVWAAMEGRIGFREAYELTGLHGGTFQKYARRLGVALP